MKEKQPLNSFFGLQKRVWLFDRELDDASRQLLWHEQLRTIRLLGTMGIIGGSPLLAFVLYLLIRYSDWPYLVLGISICVAGLGLNFLTSGKKPTRKDGHSASRRDLDRKFLRAKLNHVTRTAAIMAFLHGIMFAIPLAAAQIPISIEIPIIVLGALVLGGFSFGSVPQAQSVYLATYCTTISTALLVAMGTAAIAPVALLMFVTFSIDYGLRLFFLNFALRTIHSKQASEHAETVRLLLNDYSEHGSDWLWQVDNLQKVIDANPRFCDAAGMDASGLNGNLLENLFDEGAERSALSRSLNAGLPFRDQVIPLTVAGERRWWRLSGRPAPNDRDRIAFRGVATDVTAAKQAEDRLTHLAHFDALTNLPNRTLFNECVHRALLRLKQGESLAVLYCDLNGFKLINDTLGHAAGDYVLQQVAQRMEACLDIGDQVSRLGGDEFAIILQHLEGDAMLGEKVVEIVRRVAEPIEIDGQPVQTGISMGIALAPQHSECAEELLRLADIALYEAKQQNGDGALMFEDAMRMAIEQRRDIEQDLRQALYNNQLRLFYQPLVSIETREVEAYEALLRWEHPERGMIPPDQFIPIAEESGLIVQLGEWVIRTALRDAALWPEHIMVSVNLSPIQMKSPNLLPTIINGLASSGVSSSRLELEITESVLMSNESENLDLLHSIRALGVRIALDDFGTGYSSLNYLRSFPFDKIKIDRCFIEEVVDREDCRAIIRAVTSLAASLGMVTTAEGVENEDQLEQLRQQGCSQVQGYLFSKAVPADQVPGCQMPDADAENVVTSITKKLYPTRRVA